MTIEQKQELNELKLAMADAVREFYEEFLDDVLETYDYLHAPSNEPLTDKIQPHLFWGIKEFHSKKHDDIIDTVEDEIIEKFNYDVAQEIYEEVAAPWEEKEAEIVRICVECA